MKYFLLVSTFFFSLSTLGCHILTANKIYVASNFKPSDISSALKSRDCSPGILNDFGRLVKSTKGTLSTRFFQEEFGHQVAMSPNRVRVIHLEDDITQKAIGRENWFAKEVKLLNNKSILTASMDENVNVSCDNCSQTGLTNIKIQISDVMSGKTKTLWASSTIKIKTRALVTKRNLNVSNSPLTPGDFQEKSVFSEKPENYFTNSPQLVFYKINKPLREGDPIKFLDLTPINLVRVGQKVRVKLNNRGLILNGFGISTASGKLGQMIQLRNPKTNKVFAGKIINFNEVEVDL